LKGKGLALNTKIRVFGGIYRIFYHKRSIFNHKRSQRVTSGWFTIIGLILP
jgi:hypothetical protein